MIIVFCKVEVLMTLKRASLTDGWSKTLADVDSRKWETHVKMVSVDNTLEFCRGGAMRTWYVEFREGSLLLFLNID